MPVVIKRAPHTYNTFQRFGKIAVKYVRFFWVSIDILSALKEQNLIALLYASVNLKPK